MSGCLCVTCIADLLPMWSGAQPYIYILLTALSWRKGTFFRCFPIDRCVFCCSNHCTGYTTGNRREHQQSIVGVSWHRLCHFIGVSDLLLFRSSDFGRVWETSKSLHTKQDFRVTHIHCICVITRFIVIVSPMLVNLWCDFVVIWNNR